MQYIFLILVIVFCTPIQAKAEEFDSKTIITEITPHNDLQSFQAKTSLESSSTLNGEPLSFEKYLNIVKDNHPDIIYGSIERSIAKSKRLETQGAFDPSINSQNSFNRYNSSSAPGEEQNAFVSDTSFDILTRQGAKIALGAKFAEGDIKTPFSPTGSGGEYYASLQIPLLRDAINNSRNIKEKSAKINEVIADYVFFRTQLDILNASSNTYWDWIASKQILEIETSLLSLINGQVSFVSSQADLGNLPLLAVTEAQTELQKWQVSVNKASRAFQQSSILLGRYLWDADGKPYGVPTITQVPSSIEEPLTISLDSLEEAKLKALQLRPEFKAIDLSRDIADLERKLAKNQMMPRLDAYINQGIETGQDSIGPTTSAGLNISLPLRVRTAKGQMQQAEFKIKQLNLKERQLIQNVFLEIEDTASQLQMAYQRYLAAKGEYELALKLEQGERERFELGDSTLFVVIRRQRSRIEANTELIKSTADYFKALFRFKLVQGEMI